MERITKIDRNTARIETVCFTEKTDGAEMVVDAEVKDLRGVIADLAAAQEEKEYWQNFTQREIDIKIAAVNTRIAALNRIKDTVTNVVIGP